MCAQFCLTLQHVGRYGEVFMSLCRINGVYSVEKGVMEELHLYSV